jgi:Protein of unknown function (DUF1638)
VIACGALGGHVREIAARRGWAVELHCLPSLLHNRPERIAPAVAELAGQLKARGLRVALGYADCGSYGALDDLCQRLGMRRLRGLHCYDVLAGAGRLRELLAAEPGTYLLTDFLVRSFRRSVLAELGLDRYPQLWPDYFGHYRRVVWLAQSREPALAAEAAAIGEMFGLPLKVIEVGTAGLERELELLIETSPPPAGACPAPGAGPAADRSVAAPAHAPAPADTPALARTTEPANSPDAAKSTGPAHTTPGPANAPGPARSTATGGDAGAGRT